MPISRFIPFALLTFFFSSFAHAGSTAETFDTLLSSGGLSEQRAAFEKIASSPEQYVPLVRNRLASVANGQVQISAESLDRLLYLSAFLKDKSLIHPIERLWIDRDFLPNYCLYSSLKNSTGIKLRSYPLTRLGAKLGCSDFLCVSYKFTEKWSRIAGIDNLLDTKYLGCAEG